MLFYVIHSTVSYGVRVTLPRDSTFSVYARDEAAALAAVHELGWDALMGFRFEGLQAGDLAEIL